MFNSKDDDEEITSRYGNMNTPTTYASDAMASSFERAPPKRFVIDDKGDTARQQRKLFTVVRAWKVFSWFPSMQWFSSGSNVCV